MLSHFHLSSHQTLITPPSSLRPSPPPFLLLRHLRPLPSIPRAALSVTPTPTSMSSSSSSSKGKTLLEFVGGGQHRAGDDLAVLLAHLQTACKRIAALVASPFSLEVGGRAGGGDGKSLSSDSGRDAPKPLDIVANEIILASLKSSGKVAAMASEEDENPVWISDDGPFVVVTDPLDGSRNIDASIPTGTIFGVYHRLEEIDHLPTEEKAQLNAYGGHSRTPLPSSSSSSFRPGRGARALSEDKVGEAAAAAQGEKFEEILTRLAESSGLTARERRLIKVREAKRQREYERAHHYPQWAKVLEDGCKKDPELRAILGDSIGNPELMKQRFLERVRKKGRDFGNKETGSVVAFKVSFRDFNPLNSYIWIELYGEVSDRDVDLLGSVIQSWYVMGRLGAFNSSNLQLVDESMEYNPLYDSEKASQAMPSSFHDISDIEFQDSWARFWVDLGTADFFALDVLLNCLTVLSADHLGIKQVVFGGRRIGDWEEGMTNPQFGYKSYKI